MSDQYLEDKLDNVIESGRLNYRSGSLPTWCPGCGYFSITEGLSNALNELNIAPSDATIISGIGCASRFPFAMSTYGFHTLHGRTLPVATGVKMANDDLTVIAVGGDGDGFAIGGAHPPHAARRNVNMTYILFDNAIYGLTKGQTSPTTAVGAKTGTSPYNNYDLPLNPLLMMLSYGTSWVGRASAGEPEHLSQMIKEAITHEGFSYLHVLSPCVTFDKTRRTYENLSVEVCDLPKNYDTSDRAAAMKEALTGQLSVGVFYKENRPTLDDGLQEIIKSASKA